MTETEFVTTLADEIRRAVDGIKFPLEYHKTSEIVRVPINVYEGNLPKDAFNDDSYYPLILVEWLATNDELDGSTAKTTMTAALNFGIFAPESDGWKNAYHLMQTVRHHLLTHRLIGNKFRLTDSASWEIAPDQPTPFVYTYATLIYQALQPEDLSWRSQLERW